MENSEHKDFLGAKIGMWLFLFTEIILFGGLFLLYSVGLSKHAEDFHKAGQELDVLIGTINTLVLITSSFFIALSITTLRLGKKKITVFLVGLTILSAIVFLINKYFEWTAKISHGIYPDSKHLLELPQGEISFYNLYYTMTGLHAVHVLIGVIILSIVCLLIVKNRITGNNFIVLENSALYWHLVDLIWIFLYPLFYLIA
jgi:cytochrome c oxidase subunit 3